MELNIEVHQSIVWGMGDLHLAVIRENLKEKFDIDVTMSAPDVAYKETIRKAAKRSINIKNNQEEEASTAMYLLNLGL